jgi:enterochelin esterase-like enzyme
MGRKGTMVEREINSNYLDEKMTIKIFKPEKFSDLYKYTVCIMQDGNDYFQMGRIATLSDRLHESEEITNTVFVGIHYQDRHDRRKKYHPAGEQNESYTNFLVREVVPLLDNELPTYNMGYTRALMGDSLAGTLALMTALKYPNTFGKVIMQSPYVDETVLEKVKNTNNLHSMDIYHTIGTEETEVEMTNNETMDFVAPNRELSKLLLETGASYTYHELEGGIHTWKYWQKDMKRVLKTMFSHF